MNSVVEYKTYLPPQICTKEILRYAAVTQPDEASVNLMKSAFKEVENKLSYKVCFVELPLKIIGNNCELGELNFSSENLADLLRGCKSAVLFAATLGAEIDRQIIKYSKISPAKALMLQAIGTERIEALCNAFCSDLEICKGTNITPRFSPGYGDLPIELQRDIFNILQCEKRMCLTLNSSYLISPTKSVTAILGVGGNGNNKISKCNLCNKENCAFKGEL